MSETNVIAENLHSKALLVPFEKIDQLVTAFNDARTRHKDAEKIYEAAKLEVEEFYASEPAALAGLTAGEIRSPHLARLLEIAALADENARHEYVLVLIARDRIAHLWGLSISMNGRSQDLAHPDPEQIAPTAHPNVFLHRLSGKMIEVGVIITA